MSLCSSMHGSLRRFFRAGALGLLVIGALGLVAVYSGALSAPGGARTSEWQRRYWEAVARAEKADAAEDWARVARAYAEIISLRPDDPVSRHRRATALAYLGREDEALQELRQAVECGWADVEGLESDPAFAGLRSTPGFEGLIGRVQAIADQPVAVYVPQNLDATTAAPLIVTFHGLGENPHGHIRSWRQAADRLGAVVAAPRGIDRAGGQGAVHSFRWVTAGGRTDRRNFLACKDRLDQAIEHTRQRANVDAKRIVLAGYSQGGSAALALLADAPERFRGAVVEATPWSRGMLDAWKQRPPGAEVCVCVIVHEFDRMRPMGEAACRALEGAGVDTRLKMIAGADHELPMDGGARLIEAVRFVLGSDPTAP